MVMKSSPVNHDPNPNSTDLKFKGVRKRKWGKWVSEIRLPHSRERIWLGSYDSPVKAARAFDAAQLCLRGPSAANLNFPDNPPSIDAADRSPAEIQLVATTFANSEVDHHLTSSVPTPTEATCSVSDGAGPVLDYCYDSESLEILGSGNFDATFGLVSELGDFYGSQYSDISSGCFEFDNWSGSGCEEYSFLWNF